MPEVRQAHVVQEDIEEINGACKSGLPDRGGRFSSRAAKRAEGARDARDAEGRVRGRGGCVRGRVRGHLLQKVPPMTPSKSFCKKNYMEGKFVKILFRLLPFKKLSALPKLMGVSFSQILLCHYAII